MSRRRPQPTLALEHAKRAGGDAWVAGVDEVGRGAWAGPLTVGVAVVPADFCSPPDALADSKRLPEPVREELWEPLGAWCAAWAVGHASPAECDHLRMAAALVLATRRALGQLPAECWPAVVVLDGTVDFVTPACRTLDEDGGAGAAPTSPSAPPSTSTSTSTPTSASASTSTSTSISTRGAGTGSRTVPMVHSQVGADVTCASVSAASVLAKVTRDRIMRAEAEHFPPFDFDRNKGYPSPAHRRALAGYGLTVLHRRSWSFATRLPWSTALSPPALSPPALSPPAFSPPAL